MGKEDESCGWRSDLPTFHQAAPATVVDRLNRFVRDAGQAQYKAWQEHVPALQRECRELAEEDAYASSYTTILEYPLPYDLRRADLIVLERAAIVVVELKGIRGLSQGAIDQALGYVRDLRAYHRECVGRTRKIPATGSGPLGASQECVSGSADPWPGRDGRFCSACSGAG